MPQGNYDKEMIQASSGFFQSANWKFAFDEGVVYGQASVGAIVALIVAWQADPKGVGLGERALIELGKEAKRPIIVDGVGEDSRGFWQKMKNRGRIVDFIAN